MEHGNHLTWRSRRRAASMKSSSWVDLLYSRMIRVRSFIRSLERWLMAGLKLHIRRTAGLLVRRCKMAGRGREAQPRPPPEMMRRANTSWTPNGAGGLRPALTQLLLVELRFERRVLRLLRHHRTLVQQPLPRVRADVHLAR